METRVFYYTVYIMTDTHAQLYVLIADGPQTPAGADGPQTPAGADGPQTPAGADGPQTPAGEHSALLPAIADNIDCCCRCVAALLTLTCWFAECTALCRQ